jgi:hypothetical protein
MLFVTTEDRDSDWSHRHTDSRRGSLLMVLGGSHCSQYPK